MKFIKFVTYLFYRYYSQGSTIQVAYIKAICSLVVLIFINLWTLLIIINKTEFIPVTGSDVKGMKYFTVILYTLPFFLFLIIFVRERDLKKANYKEAALRKSSVVLLIYYVFSLFLLFIVMFLFSKIRTT